MDRQDAVVGGRGDEAPEHLGKVVSGAVGVLPRLIGTGAVAFEIVGDDAGRREGDLRAFDLDALRTASLLAVHAHAGGDGETFLLQRADVLQRLLEPSTP